VLSPSLAASRADRVARELRNLTISKQRLDACIRQDSASEEIPAALQAMVARWTATARTTTREALLRDATNEDELNELVADTEVLTAQICGPPQGDDAMLLILAQRDSLR
jgi:hypothetical protein